MVPLRGGIHRGNPDVATFSHGIWYAVSLGCSDSCMCPAMGDRTHNQDLCLRVECPWGESQVGRRPLWWMGLPCGYRESPKVLRFKDVFECMNVAHRG